MIAAGRLILSLIGGWRALLMGVAALSLAGYVLWLRADAADARADAAQLRANVRELQGANQRTAEAFSRYRADQDRLRASLERRAVRAAIDASELSTLTSEAENAPDDGLAGPVLPRGFDRMSLLGGTPCGGGNPAGDRTSVV